MEIIHVSAECYPVAKVGGLGDVVGSLPKYQNKLGHIAKVVMPMYRTKFLYNNDFDVDFKGYQYLGGHGFEYTIIKERYNKLGFDLYLVEIYGLLDREKVYGYDDDSDRFLAFQIAVADWLSKWQHRPDVVHCHDHHTGLLPFMMRYCYDFSWALGGIRTVLTIHNAQYQGWMSWGDNYKLPNRDPWKDGLLDWDDVINPLASGIKCADRVTTVSWSYLDELKQSANGLEALFRYETGKCYGILNGIDTDVWNPATDTYLSEKLTVKHDNADNAVEDEDEAADAVKGEEEAEDVVEDKVAGSVEVEDAVEDKVEGTTEVEDAVAKWKRANKETLCKEFKLDASKPLIVFIGRLVAEKAADLLPESIATSLESTSGNACFIILGSGDPDVEWRLNALADRYPGNYNSYIGYNEHLSHLMYAGADFLLMPSRVEPCGLNQMYAMRYGTIPMVRSTGGLKDTVVDMGDEGGYGIRFNHASVEDVVYSVHRAVHVYLGESERVDWMRRRVMEIDNSWDTSAQHYIDVYRM